MIITVGTGSWVHALVHADGGINVPEINEDFDQFEQKDPVQKEQPVSSPPVEEKKGLLDSITEPLSEAADWLGDKISGAWEWTKEKASAFWDWFTEICSKIAEVVIDTLSAVWDWIVKFKEYIAFAGVLILGIVLCIFATPLGIAVLSGMALSFVISMALNGWEINKMTFLETAIGGILGLVGGGITAGASRGLASGIGQKLIMGAKNSKVLGSVLRGGQKLVSKLPAPLQKVFSKGGAIGAVEGAGTSVADDILHGRKINWKNAILAGIFGAGSVAVVHFAQPAINKAVASLEPVLAKTPIVQNVFNKVGDCVAVRQAGGYHAFFLAVKPGCVDTGITDLLKSDLKKWRETVKTDKHTIAVGRTDIKGLEDEVFQGASPSVIKAAPEEAGLKPLDPKDPTRKIRSPYENFPYANRHAEEMVIDKFVKKVDAIYSKPQDVKGKLYIHQSNPDGVCGYCKAGLANPKAKNKGIFYQLSVEYPNLEIFVTTEITDKTSKKNHKASIYSEKW